MTVGDNKNPLEAQLRARIAGKAKPPGSLGRLEDLAVQIGLATDSERPDLGAARLLVFVGDHGLTAEKIAAYPSEVTGEITKLVLAGTAGVNLCAAPTGTPILVVDAGLLMPLPEQPGLISHRIGPGTRNARREPAMTRDAYQQAFDAGEAVVDDLVLAGVRLFALGEIGIGNSSAAALLAHSASDIALAQLVGAGAGVPAKGLDHKVNVLTETYARAFAGEIDCDPRRAFVEFAGFEMVMMSGAISAIARARGIAIIDGFIGTAVAAGLFAIEPRARPHCVFSHMSGEQGHKALLAKLGVVPLFDLGMRLGEGTGAALAIPMVRAAELMLTRMADLPGQPPTKAQS
jgi:nicotinate-nucleotide--dimethylbenzimidazole phosphoribosyltransferase